MDVKRNEPFLRNGGRKPRSRKEFFSFLFPLGVYKSKKVWYNMVTTHNRIFLTEVITITVGKSADFFVLISEGNCDGFVW